jgi:putative surface-exposed virulence protein
LISVFYENFAHYLYQELRMKIRIIMAVFFIFFLFNGNAFGKTVRVPGDYSLIQAAIASASDGDTVLVSDGTYKGPGNSNLDLMGKAILLKSENGPSKCIIDGQSSSRGFYFKTNEGAGTVVSGLTIRNGYGPLGGGIYCYGASPTISNCRIISNKADFGGGGIACSATASPTITGCEISENKSDFRWWRRHFHPRIHPHHNGLHNHRTTVAIRAAAFTARIRHRPSTGAEWKATRLIWAAAASSVETHSSPAIINSLITQNGSGFGGGGIYCRNSSSPTIIHCTISNNSAELWNSVNWGGGILCQSGSSPTMTNSIVWGNTPTQWTLINSSTPIVTYSDIQGGFSGAGNINLNPLFAGEEDYQLTVNSPCIDTGNPPSAGLSGNEHAALDYLENSRPQGAGSDMGAYESTGAVNPSNCPDCSSENMVLANVTFSSGPPCECLCTESITIGNGVKIERGANVTIKAPKVHIKAFFQAEEGAVVKISQM